MVFSGQVGQQTYNYYMPTGVAGQVIGSGRYRAIPYVNAAGATRATYTITPPATPDASTTYSVSIDGIVVSVQTGASTTTAQLGALINNALRNEPTVYRKVDTSLNAGTGVVTVTNRLYNTALTITAPSNASTTGDLTIANTVAAASGSVIPFGRFVGRKASYTIDDATGLSVASLIDNTSDVVLGITMMTMLEKVGIGPTAQPSSYPYTRALTALEDCLDLQAIWCECVETDIVPGDSVYISVANGGKVSKTATSNLNISSNARFVTKSIVGGDGKNLVGVYYRR